MSRVLRRSWLRSSGTPEAVLRRRAEQEAQDLFEHSTDALATVGFDGYYKRANPALVEAFGYSENELFSRPIFDLIHPDDLEPTRDAFTSVVEGEELIGFEVRHIRADGSVCWFQWNARADLDEQVIYGVGRDVTESRRAQREFEEIFNVSPDLLCIVGFDGYFKRVNPAFEQAFGYSSKELLSRPILEFGHPDDVPRSREELERAIRGETVTQFDSRYLRADGSLLWLEWSARPLPEERIIYAAARDITERKRAEDELDEARAAIEASRAELAVHADEQAALRRVATMVGRGVSRDEVLDAVGEEVGRLLGAESTLLLRYEPDGTASILVIRGPLAGDLPVGSRVTLEGENLAAAVKRSRRTERIDSYRGATGSLAALARDIGVRSAVGAPIVVEGLLWGVTAAFWTGDAPPPADAEARIAAFTELVATAIANAESRAQLNVHVEQQAALRRVATLVAEDVPPSELFDAVVREVGTLLGGDFAGLARFEDDAVVTVGVWAADGDHPPVPPRWPMQNGDPATKIAESGEPERWDDWTGVPGPIAEFIRGLGIRSTVGTPIGVAGRLWGALALHSKRSAPLPPDTESRMAHFTDLVATAIANREARAEVTRLADEQDALRRVAVLVAQQPSPSEVFTAVTQAVGLLLDADLAVLHVFPGDGTATTIASWSRDGPMLPIGTRFPLDGDSLAARIFESGAPALIHSYDEAWERAATDLTRSMRLRSAVGAPILVEGKLWGALMAATRSVEPWAENAETRIAAITELVATAIASAEARDALAQMAEEQSALRRVATLVAKGASPQDLFDAVAEELGRLLSVESATIGRFEPDDSVIAVASWSTTEALAFPTGMRWPTEGTNIAWMVRQTGRTARIDDFSGATDPIGVTVREAGIKSAVGSTIVVDGHVWGLITAATTEGPMPPDSEARLASFTELVATAIANAESWSELAASRARVVAVSAEERRRVVRDLHDGAQQRLVHSVINMKLALRELGQNDPHADEYMREALAHAEQANRELRELVYGILPRALTSGGLRAGVEELASRSTLPVTVNVPAPRLPTTIEATAYFVVSETLTNAVKHSQARSAEVAAHLDNGTLLVEVRDDGVGGADPRRGSGLTGLRDRVEALGGTIEISSPAGNGTSVTARLPAE
jgi:PAS domain S-box-containing protein